MPRSHLSLAVLLLAMVPSMGVVGEAAAGRADATATDAADATTADAAGAKPKPKIKGPTRCTLTWTGPDETCTLPGGWIGEGAGRNQNAAARAARTHLDDQVRLSTDIAVQRTAGTLAYLPSIEAQASCPAHVMDTAELSCVSDPGVVDERICFADLPSRPWREFEAECPAPSILNVEGVGFQAEVLGRELLCEALDQSVVADGGDALRRATCRAACVRYARVRCP